MGHQLYRDEILEHYRAPQNFGKLSTFNVSSKQLNPFCGDEIELFVAYTNNTVSNVSFYGSGCTLSIAGASLLTEYIKNKSKEELTKFSENDMLGLLGIEVSETRKKCALLGLAVLKDCIK